MPIASMLTRWPLRTSEAASPKHAAAKLGHSCNEWSGLELALSASWRACSGPCSRRVHQAIIIRARDALLGHVTLWSLSNDRTSEEARTARPGLLLCPRGV